MVIISLCISILLSLEMWAVSMPNIFSSWWEVSGFMVSVIVCRSGRVCLFMVLSALRSREWVGTSFRLRKFCMYAFFK